MRHASRRAPSAVGIAVILALCLTFTFACASSTPARIAFNTIDGAVDGAQQAMKGFNDRYQVGLQTEADRDKALAYYADFQATAKLAKALAMDVTQKQSAIAVASDAAAKLIALLAQILPKKTEFTFPFLEVAA